jgi:hypothetical protein
MNKYLNYLLTKFDFFYLKIQKKNLARARVVLAIQKHKCPPLV